MSIVLYLVQGLLIIDCVKKDLYCESLNSKIKSYSTYISPREEAKFQKSFSKSCIFLREETTSYLFQMHYT